MWVLACLTPIWLNILELIVNPDFEISNFKYQRPPPLDYEEEEYGDRFMNELFKSKEYKYLYDAGAVVAPYCILNVDTFRSSTTRKFTANGLESTSQESCCHDYRTGQSTIII